jgi:hypothetical protein
VKKLCGPSQDDLTPDKGSSQHPINLTSLFLTVLSKDYDISAKNACFQLGLPYNRQNAQLFYKVRSRYRTKILTGSPSTPSSPVYHCLRFKSYLCGDDIARITRNCSDAKSFSRWYRTSNRNGECAYKNDLILAFLWPSTGLFHANFKGDFTEKEARKKAADSFEAGGISKDRADKLANSLELDREHRVYTVGPVTPFEITDFRNSLGLRIYADKSHPRAIEVDSFWPTWTRIIITTIEKFSEQIGMFSEQIGLHLKVMAKINESFAADTERRGQDLTNWEHLMEQNSSNWKYLTHFLNELVIKLDRESQFSLAFKKVSRFLKWAYRKVLMRKVPCK